MGALADAGVGIRVDVAHTRILLKGQQGPEIVLLHHSKKAVGTSVAGWIRHTILGSLQQETQGDDPRRKDMVGIQA